MPIALARPRSRRHIAWLRDEPPKDARVIFEDREYAISCCTDQQLRDPAYLSGLSVVVFTQREPKRLQVAEDLKNHGRRVLDYGCQIVLRVARHGETILANTFNDLKLPVSGFPAGGTVKLESWYDQVGSDPPTPCVRYVDVSVPWNSVANLVTEWPTDDAPNLALNVTVEDTGAAKGGPLRHTLSRPVMLLLQRAFANCSDLHLVPLEGGHSGVKVYRAYAELKDRRLGRWPQPHFVKIGARGKICKEYGVYEDYVDPYLPFHLGPHLLPNRCCLGASEGVLVGDYVGESEGLGYCAFDGRSASAIACLFDRTLLGWYRQGRRTAGSLPNLLLPLFPARIDPRRMVRARELGAQHGIDYLRTLFLSLDAERQVWMGPIHGDLHAANVRVRASDAIVIDFFAYRDAPLIYDAATLEASLLVDALSNCKTSAKDWLHSVASLYEHPPLDNPVTPPNPKNQFFWFYACALQIRRYARQWECGAGTQYATALALALLIKAKKDPSLSEPAASARAAAYVLAERVLLRACRMVAVPMGATP